MTELKGSTAPLCAFYDKLCELRDAFIMKHGQKKLEEDYAKLEERIRQYPKYFKQ